MKQYLIFTIGCFLMQSIALKAQTLDIYLKEASEKSPGLKAKYAEFEASVKRVSQVNALPDPTLSFGVFISPIETRVGAQKAKISLSQMFPWFGTLKAKGNASTFLAEAKYQEFLNAKNELHFKVKKAYYPLFEIKQHILLKEAYLDILKTDKQLAITAVANNKASMTDVIRVGILIEDLQTDIQLLKDQLKPYSIRFNRLLNKTDTSEIVVSNTLNALVLKEKHQRDSVLVSNPMLRAINSKIQASESMVLLAKKKGLPQVGAGFDYAFISKRTDMEVANNGQDAIMPMVTMSLPLFRKKHNAAIAESKLLQTAMQFKKQDLENALLTSYENAQFEADKALQLISLYNKQIHKTQQMVELLYVDYSNSGKDFEEVLRMQQQLLKYQIAIISSKVQYRIALAQLDYLTAQTE